MAVRISVTFPQGDPRSKFDRFARATFQGNVDAVTQSAVLTQALAKQTLTDLNKIDRGILRASIDYTVTAIGPIINGTVFTGASWGQWVEFGRAGVLTNPTTNQRFAATAAWPPVAAIREWVRRKYQSFAPSGRTAGGRARRPNPRDLDSVAFLVGRKIYLHGIKPTPFMTPAFNRVKIGFARRVADAVSRRLADIKK